MSGRGNGGRGSKRPKEREEGEERVYKRPRDLTDLVDTIDAIEEDMAEEMAEEEAEHTSTLSEEEQLEYRNIILKKASGAWGFLLSDDVDEIVDDIEEAFKNLPNEEAKWMAKTFDDFDARIKKKGGLVKFNGRSKIFKQGKKDEYMSKWKNGLAEFDVFGDRLRDEINQRTVSFKEGYKGLEVVEMAHIIHYLANRDPDIRDVTSKIEELAIFWLPSMLETRRSAISTFVQKMKDKALAFETLAALEADQRRRLNSFRNVKNVVTFVRASNQLKKELEEGQVVFGRREFRMAWESRGVLDPSRPAPAHTLPPEVVELITSYASRINRVRSPVYIPASHPSWSTDRVLRDFVEKMMESLKRDESSEERYDWVYRLSWASSIRGIRNSAVFGNIPWRYLNSNLRWPQSILNDTLDANIGRAIATAESSLRFLKETEMGDIEKKIMHSRFRAAITAEKVHIHNELSILIGDHPLVTTPISVFRGKKDTEIIRHHAISWAFRYFVTTFLRKVNDDMVDSPTYQEDFDEYMNKTMTVGTFDNICLSIWTLIGRSPDPMRGAVLKEDYQSVYMVNSVFWMDKVTDTWWVESENLPSRAEYLEKFKDEKYKRHLEEVAWKLNIFETAFNSRLIRIKTSLEIIDRIEREMDRLVMGRLPQNPPRSRPRREKEIPLEEYDPSEAKHRAYAKLVRLKRKSDYVENVPVQSMKALTIKEDFDLLF